MLVRRSLQGQPPFAPDRGHFHHRLLDVGLSHPQAVLLIYAMTLALGAVAFWSSERMQALVFIAAVLVFGVAALGLTQRGTKPEDRALYAEDGD